MAGDEQHPATGIGCCRLNTLQIQNKHDSNNASVTKLKHGGLHLLLELIVAETPSRKEQTQGECDSERLTPAAFLPLRKTGRLQQLVISDSSPQLLLLCPF